MTVNELMEKLEEYEGYLEVKVVACGCDGADGLTTPDVKLVVSGYRDGDSMKWVNKECLLLDG